MSRTKVNSAGIQDGQIQADDITSGAVITVKILDGNVTPAKLSTGGPNWDTSGNLTAASFKTSTASTGFLKADGTVDTNTYITQAVPVGSVFHFAASTPPTGYLKANGDTVPNGNGVVQGVTADFTALYAILGSTYGAFGQLPDLRGEFIRGWDDSRGVDSGRSIGSSQADEFKSHNHPYTYANGGSTGYELEQQGANDGSRLQTYTGATSLVGGTETRPRNVALLACIKY